MLICDGYPPNIADIRATFPAVTRLRGVLFAWGDRIFNPDGVHVPPSLIAHEEVHAHQQEGVPEAWWAVYLSSPKMRLQWEIEAHRVELQNVLQTGNRATRRMAAAQIAARLSSNLYGNMITHAAARRVLAEAA